MVFQDLKGGFPLLLVFGEGFFFYAYDLLRIFKIYIAQDCYTQDSNVSISSSRLVHLNGILSTCSEPSTVNSHALRSLFEECFMNM